MRLTAAALNTVTTPVVETSGVHPARGTKTVDIANQDVKVPSATGP